MSTLRGSNPRSLFCKFHKLRTNIPAPASVTTASGPSDDENVTKPARPMRYDTAPPAQRFSVPLRDARQPGTMPINTPVRITAAQ